MPPRLNLSGDEMAARVREQTRLRVRRHRAGGNATLKGGNATSPHKKEASNVTPLQTSPVGGNSLTGGEAKAVEAVLAPFEAARGYAHDVRFLAKMRQKYPGVDLELEALKAAEWLMEPRNAKRRCSKAFLDRWLAKASADGMAPVPFSGTDTGHPRWQQPITLQKNPGPPDLARLEAPLEVIAPAELQHYRAERSGETLAEKVARLRGGAR